MMGSNSHDFISDVSLSGFMKIFYKQGFKVQGMLLFYFLQQPASEGARAVFIAGWVYGVKINSSLQWLEEGTHIS